MIVLKQIYRIGCILVIFIIVGQTVAFAEEQVEAPMEEVLMEDISFDGMQEYWNLVVDEYGGYIPELEKTSLYDFIKGTDEFSIKSLVGGGLEYLLHEVILNGKLLGSLLLLTLFSVLLQTMHTAFEKTSVSKIAYFVVYIVLIFLALNSFYLAVTYAKDAIGVMSSFMIALIPLVLGLMASFGSMISVSFFTQLLFS